MIAYTGESRTVFDYCRRSRGVDCIAIGVDHPRLREQEVEMC